MARWIKRLLVLLLIGASGAAAFRQLRNRRTAVPAAVKPEWPPFAPTMRPAAKPHVASAVAQSWVPSVDGACPDGYPIKANDNSGIFHVPGGRFYERTVPERCYATEEAAVADGYRKAKA